MDKQFKALISDKNREYFNLSTDELRSMVYKLNPDRINHIHRVEVSMAELAHHHGLPDNIKGLAIRSAILHDITKHLSIEDHIQICEKFGIFTGVPTVKLYHGLTGSLIAQHVFGEEDFVSSAIYNHTIPRTIKLSVIAKLLILADNIEGARNFIGINYLRQLAYVNIDDAVKCYLMLYNDITSAGIQAAGKNAKKRIELQALQYTLAQTLSMYDK